MDKVNFLITQDGSVGMYDEETKDIFHSVTGALKESYDKFIASTGYENFCKTNSEVCVADICFGIGYNTKSAILNAIKINQNISVKITAFEINKQVGYLSPFIKDGIETPDINLFLLSYFLSKFDDHTSFISDFIEKEPEITDKFFRGDLLAIYRKVISDHPIRVPSEGLYAFLHNIYYQNVSSSMESVLKPANNNKLHFDIKFGDARYTLSETNALFDFVFLDAFTPHKQPLLWTYEFLSLVKSKMKNTSIFSTYSNSTPVRKTLSDLGFSIGKIILEEKQFGTLASLEPTQIKKNLSDYDKGLMNTKAGIPYRDKTLNMTSSEILAARENELKNCDIISATEYKRKFGKSEKI